MALENISCSFRLVPLGTDCCTCGQNHSNSTYNSRMTKLRPDVVLCVPVHSWALLHGEQPLLGLCLDQVLSSVNYRSSCQGSGSMCAAVLHSKKVNALQNFRRVCRVGGGKMKGMGYRRRGALDNGNYDPPNGSSIAVMESVLGMNDRKTETVNNIDNQYAHSWSFYKCNYAKVSRRQIIFLFYRKKILIWDLS